MMTFDEWIDDNMDSLHDSTILGDLRLAFNAGRLKWHKVADGDLPENGIEVLNENCDKVRYDVIGYSGWIAYSDYEERYVEVDAPIAWCEVPIYTEEG